MPDSKDTEVAAPKGLCYLAQQFPGSFSEDGLPVRTNGEIFSIVVLFYGFAVLLIQELFFFSPLS